MLVSKALHCLVLMPSPILCSLLKKPLDIPVAPKTITLNSTIQPEASSSATRGAYFVVLASTLFSQLGSHPYVTSIILRCPRGGLYSLPLTAALAMARVVLGRSHS